MLDSHMKSVRAYWSETRKVLSRSSRTDSFWKNACAKPRPRIKKLTAEHMKWYRSLAATGWPGQWSWNAAQRKAQDRIGPVTDARSGPTCVMAELQELAGEYSWFGETSTRHSTKDIISYSRSLAKTCLSESLQMAYITKWRCLVSLRLHAFL